MDPRIHLSGALLIVFVSTGSAADLAPHEAVYELTLDEPTSGINGIDGRIALRLTNETCDARNLDYRFVARFREDSEVTVTDQHTLSQESLSGQQFRFETKTMIDGAEQESVKGTAETNGDATLVKFEQPVVRETEVSAAVFPMSHTAILIDKAKAGERIVETSLYDGDKEPEKSLTTTAVISPEIAPAANEPNPTLAQLSNLRSWRISESYYNSDSDGDGMPIFQTRYRLYENGVSDELLLDFGAYALRGGLSRLAYLDQGCSKAIR